MEKTLKYVALGSIVIGLFLGIRFVGTTIHYGCHREALTNVEGGDDCAPPIYGIGKLAFFLTGGSLNPLWNRDAITVSNVRWSIEKANPAITSEDDYRINEQKIAADVTTYDGKTTRYDLGEAYGCTGTTTSEFTNGTIVIGRVDCYYALTSTRFAALSPHKGFRIERYDESAQDGSIATTTVAEIK